MRRRRTSFLAVLAVLAVVGLVVGAIAIANYRSIRSDIWASSRKAICAGNLREIGRLLTAAVDEDGRFPADFKLAFGDVERPEALTCPAADDPKGGPMSCYAYVPGQRPSDDPRNVLVYEKQVNHPGGASNVLFVDGRVETFAPYRRVLERVAETEARLKATATQAAEAGK